MKHLLFVLAFIIFSCGTPTTTFYVKNLSSKDVLFSSSVLIPKSKDSLHLNQVYRVKRNDSLQAYEVKLRENQKKLYWLESLIITTDKIKFDDPIKEESWSKGIDKKGRPIYVFTITN